MSVEPDPSAARRLLSADAPPAFFAPNLDGVRHAFFGRRGGVSTGIYASLNAGPGSRDNADAVAENRRRIAAAFSLSPESLISLHQVHSPTCVVVSEPWRGPRPEADALITTTRGVALSILTADCAPVLLADAEAEVIGAAHAGWKGAFGGVLDAVLDAMESNGARRDNIRAAIGPCIAQASYEVGPEFQQRFLQADANTARFFAPGAGDRLLFDLKSFCAARLGTLGVQDVTVSPLDTFAEADALFSHRRSVHANEGDYGRNCAVIALD